jgi:hypothetical protein
MKKFYRYLIYKLYSWRLAKKDDTPIATVIFLLTITHSFQLLILYSISRALIDYPNYLTNNKFIILIFFFVFSALNYFLLYNKTRWQEYIEEFKNETEAERKRGRILVTAYLLGSVLLFFILMPVLFGV